MTNKLLDVIENSIQSHNPTPYDKPYRLYAILAVKATLDYMLEYQPNTVGDILKILKEATNEK